MHVSAETSHIEDGPHVAAETSRRIDDGGNLDDRLYLDNPGTCIDARTCVPQWRGLSIDWGLAAGALFESARR